MTFVNPNPIDDTEFHEKKFVAVCEFDLTATNLKDAKDEFSDRLSQIEIVR